MKKSNHPRKNPLTSLRLALFYSFPATLFFSYFPVISLASSDSMHLELSLPLVWLFLFSVLSLKDFAVILLASLKSFKKHSFLKSALPLLPLLFPLYLSLTILWSTNPLRAGLTSGILWCLYISIYIIIWHFASCSRLNRALLGNILLWSTAAVCLLCWLQSLLDVFGVSRETTLLCKGCVSAMFGFPHPSGFAIEPQFMGNLLLAPTLYLLYLFAKPKQDSAQSEKSSHLPLLFVFLSTLFLTFSRGAIYSFVLAYLFLFIFNLLRLKNRAFLKTLPVVIFSFLFTLLAQGVFAGASPTSDTFLSGINKSVSQLSLGKIDLNLSSANSSSESSSNAEDVPADGYVVISETSDRDNSVFSGYVEESTNIRLEFNSLALETASSSPSSLAFGFGLGSAGSVLYVQGKTASKLEIIQNEYLSLLLETGLLGLLLAALAFAVIIYFVKASLKKPELGLFLSIIFAFLLSLNFFSGLPNALHIFLFPAFLLCLLSKHKPVINQKV